MTPVEPGHARGGQQRLLEANNDSVLKLNHVVHHGGIGHHVQNRHAFRVGSRIGQVAAVDCASRIALFCGGTMAEGWACYATDLMSEAGFLTPLEHMPSGTPGSGCAPAPWWMCGCTRAGSPWTRPRLLRAARGNADARPLGPKP